MLKISQHRLGRRISVRWRRTAEGRSQARKELRHPKTAGVIVDAGRGQSAVDFHPGDFTQSKDMAEKADAPVAEPFPEEVFVAEPDHSL